MSGSETPVRDRPVRAGVILTTAHPDKFSQTEVFDNSTEFACLAEELGYDSVWILEHHFTPYGLCPSPFAMAGYLLGRTTRIKIGTAIAVLPLDHPVRIAEQSCLLDQMSHGRFVLGVGRGFFPLAFDVFGVDPADTQALLREWTAIVRQACSERTIEWHSDLITLPDATPFPEPFTKPEPPMMAVAASPSTVEWAASLGLPMQLQMPFEMESLRSLLELYDETARAHGHDPELADHLLTMPAHISDDTETARKEILENMVWWTKEGDEASLTVEQLRKLPNYRYHYDEMRNAINRGEDSAEKVVTGLLKSGAVGTPELCADWLRTIHAETGLTNFAFAFEAILDRERIIETMSRFAKEVLPRV